jgi:hypothetical protein
MVIKIKLRNIDYLIFSIIHTIPPDATSFWTKESQQLGIISLNKIIKVSLSVLSSKIITTITMQKPLWHFVII